MILVAAKQVRASGGKPGPRGPELAIAPIGLLLALCRTRCKAVADLPICVVSSQEQCPTCDASICPGLLLHMEVTHVDLAPGF